MYLPMLLAEIDSGRAEVAIVGRHYSLVLTPVFILRHILSVGYRWLAQVGPGPAPAGHGDGLQVLQPGEDSAHHR